METDNHIELRKKFRPVGLPAIRTFEIEKYLRFLWSVAMSTEHWCLQGNDANGGKPHGWPIAPYLGCHS
jgi:hypothetical protein